MKTKECTNCKIFKSVSEFHKRNDTPSGYRSHCKLCLNKRNSKSSKEWRQRNKEHRNTYMRERRKDSSVRIMENLRRRTLYALKENSKSKRTMELIGCTIEHLKSHLQETAISNGYSDFNIDDFSSTEYHIDHIIPCSYFDLSDPEEQLKCFHYTNLQILTAETNLLKSNKLFVE